MKRLAVYLPLALLVALAWAVLGLVEDYGTGDVGDAERYQPQRVELARKRLRGLEPETVTLPVTVWRPAKAPDGPASAGKHLSNGSGAGLGDRATEWQPGGPNGVTAPGNGVTTPAERRFGLDLDREHLLGVWPIPRAPHGGEVAVTMPAGGGQVEVVFRPGKPPLVSFGGERWTGVGAVLTPDGAGLGARAYADLLRVRDRWTLRLEGSAVVAGAETDWQVGVHFGAIW